MRCVEEEDFFSQLNLELLRSTMHSDPVGAPKKGQCYHLLAPISERWVVKKVRLSREFQNNKTFHRYSHDIMFTLLFHFISPPQALEDLPLVDSDQILPIALL